MDDHEDIFIISIGEIVLFFNQSIPLYWKASLSLIRSCRLCRVLGLKNSSIKLLCLFENTIFFAKPSEIMDCGDDFIFSECPHVSFDEGSSTNEDTYMVKCLILNC